MMDEEVIQVSIMGIQGKKKLLVLPKVIVKLLENF